MRKIAIVAAAAALALAMAGCSSAPASSSASAESSSSSAEASSESASSASQNAAIDWTDVKTAEEAAKGAGFDTFGVMKTVEVDDKKLTDPTFAYAGGVAQATYDGGATALYVRKADGTHTAPLTDRDKTEFAQTWTKSYDDVDVTMYGAAKGAATVVTWTDGTQEFGVTYQGLGGDEMTLDSDEVAAIVKGFAQANVPEKQADDESKGSSASSASSSSAASQASQQSQPANDGSPLSENEATVIIANGGYGELLALRETQHDDGLWYWDADVSESDGSVRNYSIDPNGNVTRTDSEPGDVNPGTVDNTPNNLSQSQVENIIWQEGLGEVQGMSQVQLEDGVWYWQVTVRGADGSTETVMVDPNGNVSRN